LGGCPFVEGSGGNLATERLVQYLNDHAFDVGLTVDDLQGALVWADKIKALQSSIVTA